MSENATSRSGKTKSIIGGMTVLGLAGVICKLVGVLFSIPLQWMIGLEGLGVYNAVFPTYNLLLTISSRWRSAAWSHEAWPRMTRAMQSACSASP